MGTSNHRSAGGRPAHLDPNVLHLSQLIEPPTDPSARERFARAALMIFAKRSSLRSIGSAVDHVSTDSMKTLLLFLIYENYLDDEEETVPDDKRWAARVGLRQTPSEEFLRIAQLAADILDWDGGEDEFQRWVRPAWLVLTDEVEFALEST
jgi:hypothetical protein